MTPDRELLTVSRRRDFDACKRLHRYKYVLGIRAVRDAESARFGTMFHGGQETWWSVPLEPVRLEMALAKIREIWCAGEGDHEPDEFELVRAEELMRGYHYRWIGDVYEPVAIEHEFRIPLVNPATGARSKLYDVGGKMDGIVRDRAGGLWLVEHKTTTMDISLGSEYWNRLRLDGQVSTYYDACDTIGYPVVGCLYDVAKRPLLRPQLATPEDQRKMTQGKRCKTCKGTGLHPYSPAAACVDCNGSTWAEAPRLYAGQRDTDETPDEYRARVRAHIAENPDAYFMRGTVVRLDSEITENRYDLWHTAKLMRQLERDGIAPRNPDACVRYGRTCEYFSVCSGETSIDDPVRFRRSSIHPELNFTQGETA